MKLLLITSAAVALLAACEPVKQCGIETMYTKEGFKIVDDQACIPEPITISVPVKHDKPPLMPQPPTPEPPVSLVDEPRKGKHPNSGRGNGSELDDNGNDVDPGNSGGRNKGGD